MPWKCGADHRAAECGMDCLACPLRRAAARGGV